MTTIEHDPGVEHISEAGYPPTGLEPEAFDEPVGPEIEPGRPNILRRKWREVTACLGILAVGVTGVAALSHTIDSEDSPALHRPHAAAVGDAPGSLKLEAPELPEDFRKNGYALLPDGTLTKTAEDGSTTIVPPAEAAKIIASAQAAEAATAAGQTTPNARPVPTGVGTTSTSAARNGVTVVTAPSSTVRTSTTSSGLLSPATQPATSASTSTTRGTTTSAPTSTTAASTTTAAPTTIAPTSTAPPDTAPSTTGPPSTEAPTTTVEPATTVPPTTERPIDPTTTTATSQPAGGEQGSTTTSAPASIESKGGIVVTLPNGRTINVGRGRN